MALFKKSEPQDLPVPQVRALAERGYSENDIRDILSKKGYNDNEINLTLQRALAMKVSGPEPQQQHSALPQVSNFLQKPQAEQLPQLPEEKHVFSSIGAKQEDVGLENATEVQTPKFNEDPVQQTTQHEDGYEVDLEPIVEAIVEEKWGDITSTIDSLRERVEEMERTIKEGRPTESAEAEYYRKQLEEKMEKLELSLEDTSAKVSAIERAFKQFIPSLTNNIKALSDAVKRVKVGNPTQEE
jgi:hypothetical protein